VTIDRDAVDAVFLDVGNTLVSMDFALLCDLLAPRGVSCTPAALGIKPVRNDCRDGVQTGELQ